MFYDISTNILELFQSQGYGSCWDSKNVVNDVTESPSQKGKQQCVNTSQWQLSPWHCIEVAADTYQALPCNWGAVLFAALCAPMTQKLWGLGSQHQTFSWYEFDVIIIFKQKLMIFLVNYICKSDYCFLPPITFKLFEVTCYSNKEMKSIFKVKIMVVNVLTKNIFCWWHIQMGQMTVTYEMIENHLYMQQLCGSYIINLDPGLG